MKSISIIVAGHSFQIRSDADEDYVRQLSEEITERYRDLKRDDSRNNQKFQAMTMVAIALLDELKTKNERCESIRTKARQFATQMISRIDELLSRDM